MIRLSSSLVAFGLLSLVGCGKSEEGSASVPAAPVSLETKGQEKKDPEQQVVVPGLKAFRDAVLHEVPEGEQRPPDVTVTGKSVGKLYEQVATLFDQVRFVDAQGRKLHYHAVLRTTAGDIRIELLPGAAPNHVRSFIALARAGYYNGLPFHKSVRETLGDKADAYLEAGCPLGTGESGYGSIGYWLKPEIVEDLVHEDGTVGAWHGLAPSANQPGTFEDVENAACKFHIGLTRSAWRDLSFTIFGKVIQGLDVAHKINQRPNHTDPAMRDRPREPVSIREVVIEEIVVGAQVASR